MTDCIPGMHSFPALTGESFPCQVGSPRAGENHLTIPGDRKQCICFAQHHQGLFSPVVSLAFSLSCPMEFPIPLPHQELGIISTWENRQKNSSPFPGMEQILTHSLSRGVSQSSACTTLTPSLPCLPVASRPCWHQKKIFPIVAQTAWIKHTYLLLVESFLSF